ncbi:MAG: DUF1080 domain-containing protein [Thermoguttaceae bacterium]|nr:DUF1080 domain-containing protein [Thermoguttaceae bacterium]
MKRTFILSIVCLLFLGTAFAEAESPAPEISLINSEMFGLTSTEKGVWKIESSSEKPVLTATATQPTIIRTTTQFGQFDVSIKYALSKGGKASLLLKTDPKGTWRRCFEISLLETESMDKMLCISASNDVINRDFKLGRGYIGVKLYQGTIRIESITVKPVLSQQLFNGKDLGNWKTYDVIDAGVNENGELTVKNGNGSLETAKSYGDFNLSLDVYVNGEDLNSGVFFRCIPGEKMNGYECQVHFGFLDSDRTKPKDCGTGGIFRRVDARKVIGNDKEWVNVYINAVGNHFAVWVNGEQVSDWTDTRKADPNPRRGLRLDPGTIQLQGHDATSDFKFRNIVIEEIPAREFVKPSLITPGRIDEKP